MSKYIKCPKCRSKNVIPLEDNSLSFDRGILGAMLTGSMLGGAAFSRTKKSQFLCLGCGKQFKQRW